MSGRLDNKVAIITGGANGIGAGTARRFVEEGAAVLIADLDEARGKALAVELGDAAAFRQTDVSREDHIAAMISEAAERWGRLDCLFNNAGFGGALGPISTISVEDFDLTIDVLLKSVFLGMKHAAPVMSAQGSGSIISTSSVAGLEAGNGPHFYSVAKSAVIQLTKSVALELGEQNIRVNAICPGFIATPMATGRPSPTEEQIQQLRDTVGDSQLLGRIGEPADVANMALFLASDESQWVTGQALVVDGGMSAGKPWSEWPAFARMDRPIRQHRPPGR